MGDPFRFTRSRPYRWNSSITSHLKSWFFLKRASLWLFCYDWSKKAWKFKFTFLMLALSFISLFKIWNVCLMLNLLVFLMILPSIISTRSFISSNCRITNLQWVAIWSSSELRFVLAMANSNLPSESDLTISLQVASIFYKGMYIFCCKVLFIILFI